MKIIALLGTENSGKSHTINTTYSFLLRDGYTQVPGYFRVLGNPKFEDFFDILFKNDIKVGFVGMGDYIVGPGKSLKSLLQELENLGCDVAICACRDEPKIKAAVSTFTNHHFVNKTSSSSEECYRVVNAADAQKLITLI